MKQKLFIKTWGCQMNAYDSARMADVLEPLGYEKTNKVEEADLVIFNTCHIREKATEKLFSELGRLQEVQQKRESQGKKTLIAVAGCVAQAEGAEIQRRAPFVQMVFGPQTYHQLPEMIARVTREYGHVLNTDFPTEAKFDLLPAQQTHGAISTFLSIQEGCDKFCTYCVVPYTRGSEYIRPADAIFSEAQQLVAQGAREITLLGQNVNAYKGGLGKLLRRLAQIPELKRLRYMTSHPRDMDDDLIAAHRDEPKVMPFLHLPVQSGSDTILEAMNRKHTAADYLRTIDKLRSARPDIALSSDFIVGFPGETDADFKATMKLVRQIGFAQAYSFQYSRRHGTPASVMPNQVPDDVATARLQEIQKAIHDQQDKFNADSVGKTVPVLFESKGRHKNQIRGRTPYLQTVHVDAPERLIGQEINVELTEMLTNSLNGVLPLD